MPETAEAIEIILASGEVYYTYGGTPKVVWDAIMRGETLACWYIRSDGVRFEEDYIFAEDVIKMVRTNRS